MSIEIELELMRIMLADYESWIRPNRRNSYLVDGVLTRTNSNSLIGLRWDNQKVLSSFDHCGMQWNHKSRFHWRCNFFVNASSFIHSRQIFL